MRILPIFAQNPQLPANPILLEPGRARRIIVKKQREDRAAMTDQNSANETASGRPATTRPGAGTTHEEALASRLPLEEVDQPDPVLQLSVGRLGAGSVTLVAVICAVVLAVVLYGLNSPAPNTQVVGTAPSASPAPAAGGKSVPPTPSAQQTK